MWCIDVGLVPWAARENELRSACGGLDPAPPLHVLYWATALAQKAMLAKRAAGRVAAAALLNVKASLSEATSTVRSLRKAWRCVTFAPRVFHHAASAAVNKPAAVQLKMRVKALWRQDHPPLARKFAAMAADHREGPS